MRAVVLSPWGAVSNALSVSDVYLTYLIPSSFTFLSIFSPCCCSAQKEAQVMRQWRRPGRMRCSGKEECGSGNGEGGGGRKQRMQRQRGSPYPFSFSCSHTFFLCSRPIWVWSWAARLATAQGLLPTVPGHNSPFRVVKGSWKSLPIYRRSVGLFLGNRIHSLSVTRSTPGQSSCPTADSRVIWPSCFPSVPLRFPTCKIRGPRCMAFLVFHLWQFGHMKEALCSTGKAPELDSRTSPEMCGVWWVLSLISPPECA